MFKVPGSLLIDRRTCLASSIAHIFLENPSLFSNLDEVALSLLIAHETFCNSSSFWQPFIQSLPRNPGETFAFCTCALPRAARRSGACIACCSAL
jgi:hypothetical protein